MRSPTFAVIVVLPADCPVTTPSLTVAMVSSALIHSTTSVEFSGRTVAVSVKLSPTVIVLFAKLRNTPVTETVAGLTVTVQVAVLFPSAVVTVIVTVPAAFAVTVPSADTVATD